MKNQKLTLIILLVLAALTALFGVVVMTDIGQVMGVERKVIIWYYEHRGGVLFVSLALLLASWFVNRRISMIRNRLMIILSVLWVLGMLSSRYLTPYVMFQTQQYDAAYITLDEVGDYLKPDSRVLVIDQNGVQRAFPPEYMWQAHIVGGDYGGENIVMTYCVMTDLASPFRNDLQGEEVDFRVLAQANNNLLIWETNSGDIIQQITQQTEYSEIQLDPVPVLEMTLRGYQKLYPEGLVYYNEWNKPMEKMLDLVFDPNNTWYGDEWMFNTSNMEDTRLPSKEHIIGVVDREENQSLALTKDFVKQEGIYNFTLGSRKLALVHFPEYETIVGFDRMLNGQEVNIDSLGQIDPFGNMEGGQLNRIYTFNGVMWAVWAYYYPETAVLK